MNWDQARYPPQDTDARVFLRQFDGTPELIEYDGELEWRSCVLAVGSNEEDTANILSDAGFQVDSWDLRDPVISHMQEPRNSLCFKGDFVAECKGPERYDHAYSLSAIEHFGFPCYEGSPVDLDYDMKAMDRMWDLLRWGGCCWITVPYGREPLLCYPLWRVYDQNMLRKRIVRKFSVETMLFFKSNPDCQGHKDFPKDADGIEWVPQAEADAWRCQPDKPHQTVFLKMRKDR